MTETWTGVRALTRRSAIAGFGAAAALWGLAGCAPWGTRAPGGDPVGSGAEPSPSCVLTPQGTEGPFYLDLDLLRRDLTEDRPGVALTLRLTVVDAQECTPIPDASVDVWHADASGVYSGIGEDGTGGERFLRGVQVSDDDGVAEFDTLYPGWYDRRTNHIHVKVHVDGDVVHTGQLYFDDDVNAAVAAAAPYAGRGAQETTNDDDMFFPDTGRESTLTVTGSPEDGYEASIVLGVER